MYNFLSISKVPKIDRCGNTTVFLFFVFSGIFKAVTPQEILFRGRNGHLLLKNVSTSLVPCLRNLRCSKPRKEKTKFLPLRLTSKLL